MTYNAWIQTANVGYSYVGDRATFDRCRGALRGAERAGRPQAGAGASIEFEPLADFTTAATYSDSQGHYLLCGIPAAEPALLTARTPDGLSGHLTVNPGQTTGADIVVR